MYDVKEGNLRYYISLKFSRMDGVNVEIPLINQKSRRSVLEKTDSKSTDWSGHSTEDGVSSLI